MAIIARKRKTIVLVITLAALLLAMPARETAATGYRQTYYVYSAYCGESPCIVGPEYCNFHVGTCVTDCEGNLDQGWGQQPGDTCTWTGIGPVESCE